MVVMGRLLFLLCCIACTTARAQTNTGPSNTLDAFWNLTSVPSQAQATVNLSNAGIPDPGSINDVISRQDGVNNTAILSAATGSQNRLEVNQSGNYNYTDASLSGVVNSVVLNQTGGNNSVSLGLGGANNRLIVNQDGGDRVHIQGLQQNNTWLEVGQGAGSNSLTIDNTALFRDATGSGIPNLRIEQSGGAAATIQNGRILGN